MSSFIGFTVIAIIAHILVWMWRPWIPGPEGGYAQSLVDGVQLAATTLRPSWLRQEELEMWRVWLLFDPRRTLVALFTFLFAWQS